MISVTTASNTIAIKIYPEIEELKSLDARSREQEAKLAILERQLEVAVKDRKFLTWVLSGIMVMAFLGIFYGFRAWYTKIQPLIDAQNKAQLEILNLQIEQLRLENNKLMNVQRGNKSSKDSVTR